MKILIINGPNLNLLGTRDTGIYGTGTLEELQGYISKTFEEHKISFFQSNLEGEIIDKLQEAMVDGTQGLVTNLGAYTHTSVALRDALEPINFPKVEVHISNIHARETFREKSLTGEVMDGIITGFGKHSYILGVQAIEHLTNQ
ncbi:MAG: 3-dehydroquinate dehydratase [Balneola sp.]|nr:3-dehydroquinate dehydratase [Balneola sp.]MBO6650237.1 3-dehydroquinate dehydratase [Balneola sp.]MBO6712178.1 3-dehydroquinate dehydratase [Balneola sp.]MBO6800372.1 3-dehydroquinate dehydratase [Balneola sp.]MBO6871836.1 3-dehydroquinate dehydratase [Balneola sp.]